MLLLVKCTQATVELKREYGLLITEYNSVCSSTTIGWIVVHSQITANSFFSLFHKTDINYCHLHACLFDFIISHGGVPTAVNCMLASLISPFPSDIDLHIVLFMIFYRNKSFPHFQKP